MNEWEKLLMEARRAVNALSNYAEKAGYEKQMYEANKAWRILYNLPEHPLPDAEMENQLGSGE